MVLTPKVRTPFTPLGKHFFPVGVNKYINIYKYINKFNILRILKTDSSTTHLGFGPVIQDFHKRNNTL